jgi:GNAT superfamily N-acetyltransferase
MTAFGEIYIRHLCREDCSVISAAFAAQNWNKPVEQFERYLNEFPTGKRDTLLAEIDGEFAGYVTIDWKPEYAFFKERSIPEIADLNVLVKFQKRGIGSRLLDEAEMLILSQTYEIAGIRVGLTADYGSAHRLYVKRGYIPDGCGISQLGQFLQYGDDLKLDDHLTIGFTKSLK